MGPAHLFMALSESGCMAVVMVGALIAGAVTDIMLGTVAVHTAGMAITNGGPESGIRQGVVSVQTQHTLAVLNRVAPILGPCFICHLRPETVCIPDSDESIRSLWVSDLRLKEQII